jgi:parvulin-like peptidyl-prolyl isomerase
MQRTTLVAAGLLVVLGAAFLVLGRSGGSKSHAPSAPSVASIASAPPSAAPAASSALAVLGAPPAGDFEAGSPFDSLPDGRRVPELPASAPNQVGFGVVLFSYAGAQAAPDAARAKDAAKQRAQAVIEEAKRDFKAAVSKGDRGSTADAGRIPRGVLEPAVEYLLFSLEKGAVHPEPIDTPRGYWVVRRND